MPDARSAWKGLRDIRSRMTFEAVVAVFMLAALIGLGSAVAIAATADDARDDLVLAELGRNAQTLLANPADTVLRSVRVHYSAPNAEFEIDTLSLLPAAGDIPSLAMGGFLGDQVRAFNQFQRRQMWQARIHGRSRSTLSAGLLAAGPILDSLGRRGVVVDPTALTTLSPFAERAWRTVLALDSRTFLGILQSNGLIRPDSLGAIDRPDVRHLSRCSAIRRDSIDATDIYCGSFAGAERSLNEELRLRSVSRMARGQPGTFSLGRARRAFWHNGVQMSDSIGTMAAGDVLYAPTTRAMILSNTVSGALAGTSLVNGSQRFFVTQGSLRSLAIALARSNVQPGANDTTTLALHNALTNSLDSATTDFIRARADVESIEAIVLDARSGGIRAMTGRTAAGPSAFLPGFEPSYIGSVVKPIILTAILSEQPELAPFRVRVSGERVTEVRGVPVAPFNAGPAVGDVGVREALRMSSNKFAAELVFESVARSSGDSLPFDRSGDIPLGVLERTNLALGLLTVFDVQPGGDKSYERDERIWWARPGVPSIIPAMERQPWYWPWAPRPSLFERQADSLRGASPTALSRFSYGQGFNEWTLLGGAQAFARVVAARPIVASMLPNGAVSPRFAWANTDWAREIRAGLRDVVQTGTARGLEEAIRASFGRIAVDVFGKTGTAHLDDADPFADRNALALFIAPHDNGADAPSCGAALVLAVDYVGARPAGGERHLEFARMVLAPLLARHWKAAITCANP